MKGKQIKQIIVVEGKTDTQKLQKIFGSDLQTIETNGLKLNQKFLTFLNQVNNSFGIIILTDPDGPGKKIREKINQAMEREVLNAFITKNDIQKGFKKIGVAEADEQAIKRALENLIIFSPQIEILLTWQEYLSFDFYLKNNRQKIAQKLGWSTELSSKTFYKWLNWAQLDVQKIQEILEK